MENGLLYECGAQHSMRSGVDVLLSFWFAVSRVRRMVLGASRWFFLGALSDRAIVRAGGNGSSSVSAQIMDI
jgi:hypothetical protein